MSRYTLNRRDLSKLRHVLIAALAVASFLTIESVSIASEPTKSLRVHQRPTVLAKIYGFFKIGYRNAITGRSMRMNVLVMENLFYERRFSKIYDLKGSTRNRLIQPTGRVNEVL